MTVYNYNKTETELNNYKTCSPIVKGYSEKIRDPAKNIQQHRSGYGFLVFDTLQAMVAGGTLAYGACYAMNSCVTLLNPAPSKGLLDTIRNAGIFNTITGIASTVGGIEISSKIYWYAGRITYLTNYVLGYLPGPASAVPQIVNVACKIKELALLGKWFVVLGPVLAVTGLGLLYTWHSYSKEAEREPLINESIKLGTTIALSVLSGIGQTIANLNYCKTADLAGKMDDIYERCLKIIANGSLHGNENEDLEKEFIVKITEERYVKKWSSESFKINNKKFDEFNSFNEELGQKIKLIFLIAIANLSEVNRSGISTCTEIEKTIFEMRDQDQELVSCARFFLGQSYAKIGNIEKAEEQYKLILEPINPDLIEAVNQAYQGL